MRKTSLILCIVIAILSICFYGCSDLITTMAQVKLTVQLDDHEIPLDSQFTLYGSQQNSCSSIQKQLGALKQATILPLEPGVWELSVEARVGGVVKASGSTTVTLKAGKQASALINLAYQFDVTFDANGGDPPSLSGIDVIYDDVYGVLPTTTRLGYTFLGWFNAASGGSNIEETTLFRETTNQTLFAQWQATTYTVTFDTQQGTGGTATTTVTYDQSMPASLSAPSRTGYTFNGYFDDQEAGTQYYTPTMQSSKPYDKVVDTQLYARWTPLSFTVTFDANGGDNPDTPTKTVSYDASYGALPSITRTGYTFDGWWTTSGNPVTQITENALVALSADQILYAKWTPNSYKVTFDAEGGEAVDPAFKYVSYDALYGVLPSTTRTGYTFDGWWTSSGGTGSEMEEDTTVAITAEQVLYAKWTGCQYTITFDANEGILGSSSTTATYGSAMPSQLTAPSRSGYDFVGYFDSQEGGTKYYDASMQGSNNWDKDAPATLYAHWTEASYTVTFDANGGEDVDITSKSVIFNSSYDTLAVASRGGYTLSGWNTRSDGAGSTITAASTVSLTTDHTLFAIWTANTYTVTFDANGGDAVNSTEMTVTYALTYGTLPNASRSGYDLSGWNTASDGGGSTITASSIVTEAKNHTLYAQWTEAKSFVGLYDNTRFNAVYAVQNQDMPTVNTTGAALTAPTKTGHAFTGMFLNSVQYYNADMTSARKWDKPYNDQGYSLLAGWTVNQYTITLDAKGGNSGTQSISVDYQGNLPRINLPTRTGYYFEAYYYNKYTDQGDLYYHAKYYGDGGPTSTYLDPRILTWEYDTDATFEATWKPLTSTVKLMRNRTSADTEYFGSIIATYDQAMPSSGLGSPPTRTGYAFAGFYDTADGTGNQYYSDTLESTRTWDKVTSTANLYAKWVAPSTVTFDSNGGSSVASIEDVVYKSKISAPAVAPTKDRQLFVGWYKDASLQHAWDFDQDVVTADMTLYAKWRDYTFGDIGPAGGVVFIVNSDQSLSWKYMEARLDKKVHIPFAPSDSLGGYQFDLGDEVGSGQSNTSAILTAYSAYTDTNYAAYYCDTLSVAHDGETYSDWFLPSDGEVRDLFDNLLWMDEYRFNDDEIWTSTDDYTYAYLISTYVFSEDYSNRWYWDSAQTERCYAIPVRTF